MDAYKLVSEVVSGNPNVDMLIVKPYLYVYVEREKIDDVKFYFVVHRFHCLGKLIYKSFQKRFELPDCGGFLILFLRNLIIVSKYVVCGFGV